MKISSDETSLPILLSAISNPTRIKILEACNDWKNIKDISTIIKLSLPSIHIHVAKLVEADLLEAKKNGRRVKIYKRKYKEVCIRFTNPDDKTRS